MVTDQEMRAEASRLALLYLGKPLGFRRVLYEALERENPKLAQMVAIKMFPVIVQERERAEEKEKMEELRQIVARRERLEQRIARKKRQFRYDIIQTVLLVIAALLVLMFWAV